MAHDTVYGFCENKCKVKVAPKTETDALDSRIIAMEKVISGGRVNSSNINSSGTITSTGLITANGGVKGRVYAYVEIVASGGDITLTADQQTISSEKGGSSSLVVGGCTYNGNEYGSSFPYKLAPNIWIESADDVTDPSGLNPTTRTVTFNAQSAYSGGTTGTSYFYVDGTLMKEVSTDLNGRYVTNTFEVPIGSTCQLKTSSNGWGQLIVASKTISFKTL